MKLINTPVLSDKSATLVICSGQTILLATVILPLIVFPVCFILFFTQNSHKRYTFQGQWQVPSLSGAGAYDAAAQVFQFGLTLQAVLVTTLMLAIYLVYHYKINALSSSSICTDIGNEESVTPQSNSIISNEHQKIVKSLHWFNYTALVIGIISCICLVIVGAISLAVNPGAHSFFAAIMFLGGIIYIVIFYAKIHRHIKASDSQLLAERVAFISCIGLSILLTLISLIVYLSCGTNSCVAAIGNVLQSIEFVILLAILCFFYGFMDDMAHLQMSHTMNESMAELRKNLLLESSEQI